MPAAQSFFAQAAALGFDTHELLLQVAVLVGFAGGIRALKRSKQVCLGAQEVSINEIGRNLGAVRGHPVLF